MTKRKSDDLGRAYKRESKIHKKNRRKKKAKNNKKGIKT